MNMKRMHRALTICVLFLFAMSVEVKGEESIGFFEGLGALGGIILDSAKDAHQTFNEEYGQGASRSLSRGSQGLRSIEPYRGQINSLYSDGRISQSERDSRLNNLFSSYDAYKSGRMSQGAFENYAESLTNP